MRKVIEWSDYMANKNTSEKKFEVALEELEGVVEQLESGDLSLEDSLAAFEKGVGLVKFCNQKLTDVEKKIELLVRDKEGKLQLKALDSMAGDEEGE
jgi:exodeoxyribonuclease VII small subunit